MRQVQWVIGRTSSHRDCRLCVTRLAGVSAVTVWNWEHGRSNPRRRRLPALENALGVPAGWLRGPDLDEPLTALAESLAPAVTKAAISGQPEPLAKVIARAKQIIATAAGNSPDQIDIRLHF